MLLAFELKVTLKTSSHWSRKRFTGSTPSENRKMAVSIIRVCQRRLHQYFMMTVHTGCVA